jgi:SCP-2 sterol transfer family
VEVADVTSQEVRVRLDDGAESGLAALLAQYLAQVLQDGEHERRRARRLRGRVAVTASDHGRSVTLDLQGDEILVRDGAVPPLDASIAAPYPALLELLRGEGHPLRDHLQGRLRVRISPRRPLLALRLYGLMRLRPETAAGRPQRRRSLAAGLLGAAALVAVIAAARAWRRRPRDA